MNNETLTVRMNPTNTKTLTEWTELTALSRDALTNVVFAQALKWTDRLPELKAYLQAAAEAQKARKVAETITRAKVAPATKALKDARAALDR